jgi:hypothetical protein
MDTNQRWRGLGVSRILIACEKCHEVLDISPPDDLREIEHRCPNKTNHFTPHWGKKGETWRRYISTS